MILRIFAIGCLSFVTSLTVQEGAPQNEANIANNTQGITKVNDSSNNKLLRGSIAMQKYNESAYLEFFPYKFDTAFDMANYKAKGGMRFDEWKDGETPYKINDDVILASDKSARIRKEYVKASMKHG